MHTHLSVILNPASTLHWQTMTLYAFYHKNDYPLIAKCLPKGRGERIKVIRNHDLDART